jgi:hypothetical protein
MTTPIHIDLSDLQITDSKENAAIIEYSFEKWIYLMTFILN